MHAGGCRFDPDMLHSMFSWLVALGVFCLYCSIDAVYVVYTLQMTKLNPLRASLAAVAIYGLNCLGVLIYTTNPWYVIFIIIGAFVGTYAVVWYERRKAKSKSS